MKNKKSKRKEKKIALIMAIILAIGGLQLVDIPSWNASTSNAYFNANQCNTFGNYRRNHNIPSGTLLYGMYLMSMDSLSDTVWERATLSATASGQDNIYYKSDLANGQWYKLGDVDGVSAITAGGELVDESSLDSLYIKYYVQPDGIVKDVQVKTELVVDYYVSETKTSGWWFWRKTWVETYPVFKIAEISDTTVSIYDYPEAYNKWWMGEFQPITEVLNGGYVTDNGCWNKTEFNCFMETWPTDRVTKLMDISLNNIAYVQSVLYGSGSEIESEMADVLYTIADSLDAQRRVQYLNNVVQVPFRTDGKYYQAVAEIYKLLAKNFSGLNSNYNISTADYNDFPEKNYWVPGQMCYWGSLAFIENYIICDADSVCTTAIGEAATNIAESISNYEKKLITDPSLSETSTEISKDKFDLYTLISAKIASDPYAKTGNKYSWYNNLYNYLCLSHIEQGIVARKKDELALLGDNGTVGANDRKLIYKASNKYASRMYSGAQTNYYNLKNQGANEQVLKNELDDEQEVLEAFRSELQFLIKARLDRLPASDKRAYLNQRLELTQSWKATNAIFKEDNTDPMHSRACLSIEKHIKWLSEELRLAMDEDDEQSKLEQLLAEKKRLKEEYQAALDDNDLEESEIILSEIEEIDEKIDAEIMELIDVLGSDTEFEASVNGDSTLIGLKINLKYKVIDDIDDGKTESAALNALVMIGATDIIDELKSTIGGNDNFEQALETAYDNFNNSGMTEADINLTEGGRNSNGTKVSDSGGDGNRDDDSSTEDSDSGDGDNTGDAGSDTGAGSDGDGGNGSDKDRVSADLSGSNSKKGDSSSGKEKSRSTEDLLKSLEDTKTTEGLTSDEIEDIIEDCLGKKIGSLDAKGKIIAAVATGLLGDVGYTDAREISKSIMSKCVSENNPYAYATYKNKDNIAFVSLKTISKITDFRYDFKSTEITMENVGKGQIYLYKLRSKDVILSKDTTSKMDAAPARYDDVIYVISSETQLHYDVTAEPVTDTEYSGALTTSMEDKKKALVEALVQAIIEKNN